MSVTLSSCRGVGVARALSDFGCNKSVTSSSIIYFQVGPSSRAAVKYVCNSLDLKSRA